MIKEQKTCEKPVLNRIMSDVFKLIGAFTICVIAYVSILISINNYKESKCMKEHNVTDGYGTCYFD